MVGTLDGWYDLRADCRIVTTNTAANAGSPASYYMRVVYAQRMLLTPSEKGEGGGHRSSFLVPRSSFLGPRSSVLGYLVPAGAWAILVRCVWMGRASREVCAAGLARVLGRARRTRQVARHAFCKTTELFASESTRSAYSG